MYIKRPSAGAMIYMQAWQAGIADRPFDLTIIPNWLVEAAELGLAHGERARSDQWLAAKEMYPEDLPYDE